MKTATFQPTIKQWQAWEFLTDNIHTEIGYGGAASGGKSYLGCAWVVTMCKAYPGVGYLMGRKELTNLKRTTIVTLFKVLQDFGISENEYNVNWQNNVMTFTNGSQIFFLDLGYKPSDPLFTRLGGLELTGYFIDESNEIPVKAIDIIKTRVGRRKNEDYSIPIKGLETFNPDKGHVYTRYYKPFKNDSLPEYRAFLPALATDNPHTPAAYIQQLERSDEITKQRLLYGNFDYDDDPTLLVDFDSITDIFTNTVKEDSRYISCDVARLGGDRTVISLWNGLACKKIDIHEKITTDTTARFIREMAAEYKVPFSNIIIDEDGIGGGVIDQLRGVKGFIANTSPFGREKYTDGKMRMLIDNFNNLKSQCGFKLADLIKRREIAIHDTTYAEQITEELVLLKQDNSKSDGKVKMISKDDMKLILGKSPDILDVFIMRMWFEFRQVNDNLPSLQNLSFGIARNYE